MREINFDILDYNDIERYEEEQQEDLQCLTVISAEAVFYTNEGYTNENYQTSTNGQRRFNGQGCHGFDLSK